MRNEMAKADEDFEKQVEQNKRLEGMIEKKEKDVEEYAQKILDTEAQFLKEKDDPLRLEKNNETIQQGVGHLTVQIEALKKQRADYDKEKASLEKKKTDCMAATQTVQEEYVKKKEESEKCGQELDEVKKDIRKFDYQKKEQAVTRESLKQEIEDFKQSKRGYNDETKNNKKRINECVNQIKKIEHEITSIDAVVSELNSKIDGDRKSIEELRKDKEKFEKTQNNLQEEQQIFIGQLVKKGIEDKNIKSQIAILESDIKQSNEQVKAFDEAMTNCKEEIKWLTTIREKMARTASQASAQARETKEEQKVKELLILDLTKQLQQKEFELNSFVALFQEVKNGRNRYVAEI